MNTKRIKSSALRDSVQKRVAEYKLKNPDTSRAEVAKKFNCTPRQVLYAEERYKKGDFDGKGNKGVIERSRITAAGIDMTEALEDELRMVLAQLGSEDLTATQRITVLEKYMSMRRNQQMLALESHIKRTDAAIIKLIVQRFVPDISDEDVIKIYREAYETWKHSLK